MRKIHLKFLIPKSDESNVVGKLFKVIFKYLNKDNEFSISEKTLVLNLMFEEVPEEIIDAISELPFSNAECLSIEDVQKEDNSPSEPAKHTVHQSPILPLEMDTLEEASEGYGRIQGKTSNKSEENSERGSDTSKKTESSQKKSRINKKHQDLDEKGRQIFDEIVSKSKSFEEFIQNFGEHIGLSNHYKSFFVALVKTACTLNQINLAEISNNIDKFGEKFSSSKKVTISEAVKTKFGSAGSDARFMTVLEEMVKYQTYNFADTKAIITEPMVNEATSEAEDNKDVPPSVEFKTLSDGILKKLYDKTDSDFSAKIGTIFDIIKASQGEKFYIEHRDEMIRLITITVRDISTGIELQKALTKQSDCMFGSEAHIAKAFILQSAKDYCKSVGLYDDLSYVDFFEDLKNLM